MDWTQFHFLRPWWLVCLLPLLLLLVLIARRKLGSRGWETVCDEALLPFILIGKSRVSRRLGVFVIGLGGLLAILALAGPVWEKLPQPVFSRESALVIALDLSLSMQATDVSPSRAVRARFKVADILALRQEGQTAVIVYAADAFVVTPLTDDTDTIISQLPALSPEIMPAPGNRTDIALRRSADLLQQAGMSRGDILLITDEVDAARAGPVARELRETGYRISVLGVGSEEGVPIPLPDGRFLKDATGNIVIPVLDEEPMRALVQFGGGRYQRLTPNDSDVKALAGSFAIGPLADPGKSTRFQSDVWREQGPWLLLPLLALAVLGFRRGYLLLVFCLIVPLPRTAAALDWTSLWQRPDQQGSQALANGQAAEAAQLFADPAWKGAAQYRAGDYAAASRSLQQLSNPEARYNLGNALARQGRLQEAIAAYAEVLQQVPEHEDAAYNKALLEKELRKQQQQQQEGQGDGQDQARKQDRQQKQDSAQQQQQNAEQAQSQGQSDKDGAAADRGDSDEPRPEADDQGDGQQRAGVQDRNQEQQGTTGNSNASANAKPPPQRAEQKAEEQPTAEERTQSAAARSVDEQQQATEQWLRRIPDDPAGLLRRKFRYQYSRRARRPEPGDKTW